MTQATTGDRPSDGAASSSTDGLERMFRVAKTDHPDFVGGIVWSACELRWINERITLAILAKREACAMICDDEVQAWLAAYAEGSESRGYEVEALEKAAQRMRSNV